MGNSTSAGFRVESSARVILNNDCSFQRWDAAGEISQGDQLFFRYTIAFTFRVCQDSEFLKGVYSCDSGIYSSVAVGHLFPLKRSGDLASGMFEEIGRYEPASDHDYQHSFEMLIPKALGSRWLCGYLLDEENVVVAKACGVVAFEDEFVISDALDRRVSIERMSRKLNLDLYSKLEKQRSLKTAVDSLANTVDQLAQSQSSRPEFMVSPDGVRLSFRAYHPPTETAKALFVIVVSHGGLYDLLAARIARLFPIASYILEMRGYSSATELSNNSAINTASKEKIWTDVKAFVRHLKINNHRLPVVLAGHFYQAGLVLNYSCWKDRESVDAYCFISPNFGPLAQESIDQRALARLLDSQFSGMAEDIILATVARSLSPPSSHLQNSGIPASTVYSGVIKACSSPWPKRQFELIDRPFGFWVGEREQLVLAEKVLEYPRSARSAKSSINVCPDQSMTGVLLNSADGIGGWIMGLDSVCALNMRLLNVNAGSVSENNNLPPSDDQVTDYRHPVLRDVDLLVNNFTRLGLNEWQFRYLLATDGAQLRYRVFVPQKKPVANLVFLQSDVKVITPWLLSNKCDVSCYAMDIRGIDDGSACHSKETIVEDVRLFVRHLKCNEPELPLILGGHGPGASIALNYSAWRQREPVNGYLFLSPLIDMSSYWNSDLVNKANMNSLFAAHLPRKSWFFSNSSHSLLNASSSTSSSSLQRQSQKVSRTNSLKFIRSDQQFSDGHDYSPLFISVPVWQTITCWNIKKLFLELEVPFGLWIGADDELLKGRQVVDCVRSVATRSPLTEIELVPNASHMSNLIIATAYMAPFIRKFTRIVGPSLSFKLRNPSLDDFKVIQFIGRGSFGRVFLVQHRVSEKYFAMKVLSKSEVFHAKEVKHVINERNVLREINSSFVVSFVGSFQDQRHLFILMEYVIGGELFTQLSVRHRFSNEVAVFYAAEIVLFFEDIHSKGLIYRDLKPENLLIDAMGHVKVTDMAKRTHTFCGTPQYMAPEVILEAESECQGVGYSFGADYYSLGVLIYEMLVGHTPFADSKVGAVYRKVLYGSVEFPWGMDLHAKDLVKSLLQRDLRKRLGCTPGFTIEQGIEQIKRHRWFKNVDWAQLRRREVSPPFVPRFTHAGDASNYLPAASSLGLENCNNYRADERLSSAGSKDIVLDCRNDVDASENDYGCSFDGF